MIDCDRVFDVLTRGPFPSGAADDAAVEAHLARCRDCARLAAALRPAIELFEEAVGPHEGHDLPSYWGEVAVESSDPRSTSADTARRVRPTRRRALVHYSHAVGELTSSGVWQVAALVALGVFVGSLLRGFAPLDGGRNSASAGPAQRTAARAPVARRSGTTIVLKSGPRDDGAEGRSGEGRAGEGATGNELAENPAPGGGNGDRSIVHGTVLDGHDTVRLPEVCLGLAANSRPTDLDDEAHWLVRRYVDIDHCCTQCHNAAPDTLIPRSATAAVQKSCRYCHVN